MAEAEMGRKREKLTLLLALVPWLLEHERVSVTDTAKTFGVPAPQIRSLVLLLAVSGVPGATATYQHEDLFDIDWDAFETHDEIAITQHVALEESPRFSAREAAALIAGLHYIQALPEHTGSELLSALHQKLALGASAEPKPVAIAHSRADQETLSLIAQAIRENRRISFPYLSASGYRRTREVDPLRLDFVDDQWYLRGWCHLRQGVRTFRFDRMGAVWLGNETANHRLSEVHLSDKLFEPSEEHLQVTLEFVSAAVPLLSEYFSDPDKVSFSGELGRAIIRVAHYHALVRLVSSMSSLVRVVEPDKARQAVAEWAARALENYR